MTAPSTLYEIWRPGSGHPRKPSSWQTVTALEALSHMREAFRRNLGKYADRWPECPINATAVWWRYLHQPGCEAIDLIRIRVRRRPP
jgi:hypothetical protein